MAIFFADYWHKSYYREDLLQDQRPWETSGGPGDGEWPTGRGGSRARGSQENSQGFGKRDRDATFYK